VRTTGAGLESPIDPEVHRRHLGVAALVLWLAAIGAVVLLWSGCVAPAFDGCVVEDVRR
jgi:hypothetical protein